MTVWCGVLEIGIVGPHVFEEDSAIVIVNSQHYDTVLHNFRQPHLGINLEEMCFQQVELYPTRAMYPSMEVVEK